MQLKSTKILSYHLLHSSSTKSLQIGNNCFIGGESKVQREEKQTIPGYIVSKLKLSQVWEPPVLCSLELFHREESQVP